MKKGRQAAPLPLRLENPPAVATPSPTGEPPSCPLTTIAASATTATEQQDHQDYHQDYHHQDLHRDLHPQSQPPPQQTLYSSADAAPASTWSRSGETSPHTPASTLTPTTTAILAQQHHQLSPASSSSISLSPRWFPRKSPKSPRSASFDQYGHHQPLNNVDSPLPSPSSTTTPTLHPSHDESGAAYSLSQHPPRLQNQEPQKLRKALPPHIQQQHQQHQHQQLLQQQQSDDDANTDTLAAGNTTHHHGKYPTISTTFYDSQPPLRPSLSLESAVPSQYSYSHSPSTSPSPSHPYTPHHQHSLSSPQPQLRDGDLSARSTTRRIRSGLFSFGRDKDKTGKAGQAGTLVYGYGSMTSRSETSMSRDSSTHADQSLHNPYSTTRPSRSDLSLSSAGGEGFDSLSAQQRSNNPNTPSGRRGKTKPFHILGRGKNSSRDGETPSPNRDKNDTVRIVEPEYDNLSATSVSAPASRAGSIGQSGLDQASQQRSLRTKMSSTTRNRSEDRAPPRSGDASAPSGGVGASSHHTPNKDNHHNGLKEHSRHQSSAPREPFFAHFLKNGPAAKAADMIGKGLFGKGGWSGNAIPEKETVVADEDYEIKVICLPLVEQTRKTRISPRLETSRDKTEFWMPALAWRAIDYLNYKGSDVEGLYRVPGSGQQVKRWQRKFDEEYDVDLFEQDDLYDINIIGSMLKAWLRELPDELLPKVVQDRVSRECHGATEVPQMLIDELSNLPPFNYYLLFAITCHLSLLLAHQDKNKMSYPNLCICFQPCMKIDAFCFRFLVQDWRKCWKGCKNEARYIEEEYALFDQPPPRGLAEPRQPVTDLQDPTLQAQGEDGPLQHDGSTSSDKKQATSNASPSAPPPAPTVTATATATTTRSTMRNATRSPTPTMASGSNAASAPSGTAPAPAIVSIPVSAPLPIPTITGPTSPPLDREHDREREAGSLLKNRMAKKKGNTPTLEQNATFDDMPTTPTLTINSNRDLPVRAKPSLPHLQISPIAPLSPFSL